MNDLTENDMLAIRAYLSAPSILLHLISDHIKDYGEDHLLLVIQGMLLHDAGLIPTELLLELNQP